MNDPTLAVAVTLSLKLLGKLNGTERSKCVDSMRKSCSRQRLLQKLVDRFYFQDYLAALILC